MDAAAAAALKATLQGIALPAEKLALLEHAVQQHAQPHSLEALRSLPEREYASLDEVVEELLHVQPRTDRGGPARPHEESGRPPGGDDYLVAHPSDTGQVRDLDKAAE